MSGRGHEVTAIARNPDTIAKLPGVTVKKGDVFDKPGLVQLLKGHKAEATKGGEFLELLRKDKELDWTFLSPSAVIAWRAHRQVPAG